MTNPPPPGGQPYPGPDMNRQPTGQYPVPQGYPQQPVAPGYGGPYGAYSPPPAPATPPTRNVVGLIAFVAAIIGFVFACIPGALIIGWILLPVSFILGIVGLFLRGAKWPAISAIVIAVVGTIVGVIVFATVVSDAIDDATGANDKVTAVDKDGNQTTAAGGTEIGSRTNPASPGTTLTSGDWQITLNSFESDATQKVLAANSFNQPPAAGKQYALATFTVKYTGEGSKSTFDLSFAYITAAGNVIRTYDNDAVTPDPELDGEVYTGGSLTGNVDFEIPKDDTGLVRVQIGYGKELFFAIH